MNTGSIIVTGFGPFGEHKVNASWEAVKQLPDTIMNINIIKREVPVIYDYVQSNIPSLWKQLDPLLVIHVGVSSVAAKLTLEKCARREKYERADCTGIKHSTGQVCCIGDECIFTQINVDQICDYLNNVGPVKACVSSDAGKYLCEFIYYTSLNVDRSRTLFIHVPPIEKPYSSKDIANGLLEVIKSCLEQMNEVKNTVAAEN